MRALALVLVVASACATSPAAPPAPPTAVSTTSRAASQIASASGPAASAVIEPRSGSTVSGTARFVSLSDGLGVHVELQGATPGQHGIHIHEKGDCSDPEAKSAGGHYNPGTAPHHGGPRTAVRHGGDLGNIEVDSSGRGVLDVVVPGLSVNSVQDGVVGRSIVVHEKADDLQSDPAGNSGVRVACGQIQPPPVSQ